MASIWQRLGLVPPGGRPPWRLRAQVRLLRMGAWAVVLLYVLGGSVVAFMLAGWSVRGWISWSLAGGEDPLAAAMLGLLGIVTLYYAWQVVRLLRFLVTPALEDHPAEAACRVVTPQEAKPLYELSLALAQQLNKPCPDEIRLSVEPQCFVVEQRRFGVYTRRRLVLVLGIPQLLVFDIHELKALLAHEFSHLAQDTTTTVFLYRFSEALHRELVLPFWLKLRMLDPLWWFGWVVLWAVRKLYRPLQHTQEFLADWASASLVGPEVASRTMLKEWWVATQFQLRLAEAGQMPQGWNQWWEFLQEFARQWEEPAPWALDYLRQRLNEVEADGVEDSHPTVSARLAFLAQQFPPSEGLPEAPGRAVPARVLVPLLNAPLADSAPAADAASS